jgi:asparagine synthase (glutamine-hydrolysing)
MCGIAGVLNLKTGLDPINPQPLNRVRDHMRVRGPDGYGTWISPDGRIGLAHRRLSIIDLSERGAQPMHAGDLSITFNGEIYNYKELRLELEEQGEDFHSDSDTEVLLKLYRNHGVEMFSRLRGMYAFAIWDAGRGRLLLGRDPFGIKPLYYSERGGRFWFASQTRSLVDTGTVSADPDTRAWTQFLLWGSIPEPRTAYAAIRALPAGSYLLAVPDRPVNDPVAHFDLAATYAASGKQADQAFVRSAVLDSIRHHLVADVPVGVFLSAGIDSAAVLGIACDVGPPPESVTLGFSEFGGEARDETPLAAALARHYGSKHTIRWVNRAEFETDLPAILAAMDQPSIDGVNTWFVAKAAREIGWKVALSGLGGDELFGGYPSFRDVPTWVHWLRWAARMPKFAERCGQLIGLVARHPKAQGLLRYGGSWSGAYYLRRGLFMPREVEAERPSWLPTDPAAVDESLAELERLLSPDPGSDHARVSVLETGAYMRNQLLRDSDWASMAHSIELRVPLVDSILAQSLAPRMPGRVSGPAKAALALAPGRHLPDWIFTRPKTGFETPLAQWIGRTTRSTSEPWARVWARIVLSRWQSARTLAD